ncbi:MAG: hypothetical protein K2J60_04260 [Acetatifactor sp.]|nr:hypothetical protein [Acetatifactor sp.]
MKVYKDKIYYIAAYKSVEDGENIVKKENDVIGRRLNRINLDGTEKEIIFNLTVKGMRIIDISGGNLRQIGQIPEE